jgi:hypoxanthine phosphoribosyltransferase
VDIPQRKILYRRGAIRTRVKELAATISRDYAGREPLVIGILKGSFVFLADLIRFFTIPCEVDFVRLASYGSGTSSSGEVVLTKDVEIAIEGRDILIVEDVLDSGLTLSYLVERFRKSSPRSMKVCTLIDKRLRRTVPFEADYVGFTLDDGFVVGYGIDVDEKSRFLPDICIIEE